MSVLSGVRIIAPAIAYASTTQGAIIVVANEE